jgi:transcriptional regulator with XRE-family HTH domain
VVADLADSHRDDDWAAVGRAIQARLAEARLTQMDVAAKAHVSLTTFRELQHNLNPRRRRPQTLAAVSEALGWPPDYLRRLLRGEAAAAHADEVNDPVLHALDGLSTDVESLRRRVEQIERQLARGGERP